MGVPWTRLHSALRNVPLEEGEQTTTVERPASQPRSPLTNSGTIPGTVHRVLVHATRSSATKLTTTDDASLWLAATSGTATAFATLFQRHRPAVFRTAYGKTQSIHDAEDVVATVFLEAWRNKSKVRIVQGSILPWLLATTTLLC